ncbi:helix-turn-helix transcriptional regulator [Ornithinimicrobium ciconiae]|uniref:Helix-turn-helix transcriptional regulator n=1 Tax=Ornithinimicrobium ciconiae TaxID=2594265 RepID=A0A516GE39_9MICO|nr:helix-turn-helix transcriptional regulator [Ornithinimicrobium ciconiae]QDO89758.1 helix-turn-helix transcriptional regulator [Ornithinimicrobium ciconiae]
MTSIPSSLGALIRQQRELAALPMRQLATMAGISGPYLSQIENGLRTPSDQVLRSLATILGIDPDELVEETRTTDELEAGRRRTRAALQEDPNLTPAQKRTVLDVYAALVGTGAAED